MHFGSAGTQAGLGLDLGTPSGGTGQGSMDGFALARLVAHRWPSIPVLVVSGMGTPGPNDMPEGARFIPKPYEPTTLVRTLQAFIHRAA